MCYEPSSVKSLGLGNVRVELSFPEISRFCLLGDLKCGRKMGFLLNMSAMGEWMQVALARLHQWFIVLKPATVSLFAEQFLTPKDDVLIINIKFSWFQWKTCKNEEGEKIPLLWTIFHRNWRALWRQYSLDFHFSYASFMSVYFNAVITLS